MSCEQQRARSVTAHSLKLTAHCSELLRRDSVCTNIRTKRFGNYYTAVGLLVILHDRNPGAAHSQSAAVQRMHEFRFILAFGTIAEVRPSRLVGLKIRARRDLAKELLSRQPHLNIIRLR